MIGAAQWADAQERFRQIVACVNVTGDTDGRVAGADELEALFADAAIDADAISLLTRTLVAASNDLEHGVFNALLYGIFAGRAEAED